ncbi:putative uncharacterized protein [Clostridium sp. CAG:452]|mgnify:FL=1|nr:putative uncharacterized protein [Clostridium sp. CAG:452]
MKLQNMTVIFIIIMIPIILVVSYYIGLQINTITMQKNYTVKLQTAAKDSIQALEINTVEWNSASSNLADSKRRDVLASINTFTTSLANNMGIGGAGKGRIQTYIPAIVYTMYDGYYIYSASLMKDQDTDKDGLTQFNADGTIKSNETSSYQYILKPYSPYSARYASANGSIDVTVNYTLDNYIRVYGTVNGEYQAKEGYLVVCDDNAGVEKVSPNGSISGITYRGATIKPETLKEQVYIENKGVEEYPYIYDQYDNKLYWDKKADPNEDGVTEGNYFSVDKYNNKVYLQNALPEGDAGFSITNRFRKISIPMYDNREDEWTVQKVFQILNPGGGYKFYYENQSGAFVEFTSVENIDGSDNKKLAGVEVEKDKDFSAINYCVESYVFTKWVTKNLGSITVGDMKSPTVGQYNNVDNAKNKNIFAINPSNNPDPENDVAYATSVLAQHKKDIIINTIEKNLSQATEQAKKMNPNYEYRLPQLSYDEWEQALSNISIIAFMQGMPIGLKYYNNYAIATSTLNKEFVDPDELYFAGKDDQYYHQRQCEQATGSDYVGYRSIDYVAKSYEKSDNGTTSTYYPHAHADVSNRSIYSVLECYYCLVNRSTYNAANNKANWNDNPYNNWTDSYYNALARERYMQLDEPGTYKPNVTITKTASESSVEYGDSITYTIKITNNGIVDDTITFLDYWKKNEIDGVNDIKISTTNTSRDVNEIIIKEAELSDNTLSGISSVDNVGIYIYAGETITITYKAIPKGTLGKDIKNTAAIYSFTNKDTKLAEATAITSVEKKVTANVNTVIEQKNIYLVLDTSNSMDRWIYSNPDAILESQKGVGEGTYPEAVRKFIKDVRQKGSSVKGGVLFSQVAVKKETGDIEEKKDIWRTWGGTLYVEALNMAKNEVEEGDIMVFFTDGNPTYGFVGSGIEIKYSATSKLWKSIKNEADEIKRKGVTIYTAGFGNESNLDGLKKVVASPEKAFYGNNIDTLFEDIFNGVFEDKLEGIEKEYKSIKGKIQLQYVNRIEEINIGGNKLQNFKDYIEITDETDSKNIKGTLDLTKLNNADLSKPISIIYK